MSYTPSLIIPAHDAVLSRIDGGASTGPAAFRIYDAGSILLVELPLDVPAGAVDGTTGKLTLSPGAAQTAAESGEADHADLIDNGGVVLGDAFPVVQGSSPVAGSVVITSTSIAAGATIELLSASIG